MGGVAASALVNRCGQLGVRRPLLTDTEDAFRHRHPNFRPANDDEAVTLAAY
jgi:hypothetical protein